MKLMRESRWFEEGRQAAVDGKSYDANPYAEGSPKWYIWNEGFNS
jgi:ribosome modulation factor